MLTHSSLAHVRQTSLNAGTTESRAERNKRRDFAAEAGETGDIFGEELEDDDVPRQGRAAPPRTLEVCLHSARIPACTLWIYLLQTMQSTNRDMGEIFYMAIASRTR